jgi:protein-tyrosine phosphatase
MKVLMVCLGNICRSPMAEGIFRQLAQENELPLEVDSCGTANYHVGEPPDERAIRKAHEHGIDISTLRGRQIMPSDFQEFDLILTMDNSNYLQVMDVAKTDEDGLKVKPVLDYLYPGEQAEVPDPWYGGYEGFEGVYQLLKRASQAFKQAHFNG